MKLIILTGMSGAGKHTAFKTLEDMGYNCVDNLPIPLLKSFVELAWKNEAETNKVAVGIDVRSGESMEKVEETLNEIEADGKDLSIVFLDAEDDVLIARYKETRRNHPLAIGESLYDGIAMERQQVAFLKERADYVIDTTHLLTKDLKAELRKIFLEHEDFQSLFVTVMSFGYKYGIPQDADLVFDVRFLPNPYYVQELRPMTGNDKPIQDYVMNNDIAEEFSKKLMDMIRFLIPRYIEEGKTQLVIAVGCTGGKHRSVTVANEIYQNLLGKEGGYGIRIEHRDIDKDRKRGK
ncbi:MAG: RNase adapter RapZ [Lachnospiraceae bacterium]|nr:RNase adapter RapZ [Lachnospiraceae bacterium]